MAMGRNPEANCVFGHSKGCQAHRPPQVNGKPFHLRDHLSTLQEKGLAKRIAQLRAEVEADKKPPGQAKKLPWSGNALVYPARHFA